MKNYSSFNFLPEKIEKIGSTELYGAALEGSTIFFITAPHAKRQWKAVN